MKPPNPTLATRLRAAARSTSVLGRTIDAMAYPIQIGVEADPDALAVARGLSQLQAIGFFAESRDASAAGISREIGPRTTGLDRSHDR